MSPSMVSSLLRVAMLANRGITGGHFPTGYEWETGTAYRVLLRSDGVETDIVYDKFTGCYRIWVDGCELGDPGWN